MMPCLQICPDSVSCKYIFLDIICEKVFAGFHLVNLFSFSFSPHLPHRRFLHNNRLQTIPTSLGNHSHFLTTVTLQSNNIFVVPKSFTILSSNTNITLSMDNNPSECFRAFDADLFTVRVICDCAQGYFGADYCEPIDDYLRLPTIVSQLGGLHMKSRLLKGGEFNSNVTVSSNNVQVPFLNIKTFEIPFPNDVVYNVTMPAVYSVWAWDSQSETFTFSPAVSNQTISLFSNARVELSLPPMQELVNLNAPTNVEYQCIPPLPNGLAFLSDSAVITGRAENSQAPSNFTIIAFEKYTQEEILVSHVVFSVADCGPDTCLNGGICNPLSNHYDSNFTCACVNNTAGNRCEQVVRVVETSSTTTTTEESSTFWTTPTLIFIPLLIIALLGFAVWLVWFLRKRERDNKPVDFDAQMKEMMAMGLITDRGASRALKRPRELKRSRVKVLDENMGSGAFGSVYKVGCW